MAINLKFDLLGNPEPPTIVLANRNGNKLGQLDVNVESIDLSDKFNDASEFSFTLNKYIDGKITNLWDKVVDFKLVYCKEWDMWFEIKVELDEATETVKTVFCTQLGQAELSQIMLYNIEINTEEDIERDDYKISILYNEDDPKASILNRLLDKAPHYSIYHVDSTIANIQRSFSFDGTSIYDAFQEIAEEIGCLFVFHSNSDENGKIQRIISVYDLQQNCLNTDCRHRGEFTDVCPKCGGTDIKNGYGEDTLIFVTSDELASGGIQLVTDTDSVKNCFKLEAGDDLMTATVRNCNPNGSDYIWYFSDAIKEDMPDELVEKIESYDEIYKQYYNDYASNIDTSLLNSYNSLVNKYSVYNEDLQTITSPVTGYASLMNAYYNAIDLALYLKSGLMPSIEMSETNATEQAKLLVSSAIPFVAVTDEKIASLATVNSAVLGMAKIIVKSTYKVQIKDSVLNGSGTNKSWSGNFIITNYSDEEDAAVSDTITVDITDEIEDQELFIKQKIDKALNKENTDDYSISGLFEKEYDDFCNELKKYALNPLTSFHDACQSCIDILIEQGVANGDTWADTDSGSESNLYEKLYMPYYNKLMAIEAEMKVREDEINIVSGVYDLEGKLVTEGLQTNIEKCKNQIQNALNFEEYLGAELWQQFCVYRREDKYSNDNYISDGLDNAELFKKASDFIDVAKNEIYKSSELQHSISTTLNNLLAIPKFKILVEYFNLGNWIRVQIDDEIYKLRLLEYGIDYGSFDNISVEFSDVTKIKNGITDVESILSQASSMATSYGSVQKQANQGEEARNTVDQWIADGLNSALVQIQNNDTEEITFGRYGLLGRSYSDITETYSPEQIRLTHNILCFTDNNWKSVRQAIGKHNYYYFDENSKLVQGTAYGMTADFVTAGNINGSQFIGGEIYSSNYSSTEGTYFNLGKGDFSLAGKKIEYDADTNKLSLRNVELVWETINSPTISVVDGLDGKISELEKQIDNAESIATTAKNLGDTLSEGLGFKTEITGEYVISPVIAGGYLLIGDKSNTYAEITTNGILNCQGANITGTITASTFVGGDIYSNNYNTNNGTHFDLNSGDFSLAGEKIVYNASSNVLSLKNVVLDWNTIEAPKVEAENVDGFVDAVTGLQNQIDGLQTQADGGVTTWFYNGAPTLSNFPANVWDTTDLKNQHIGDYYYDNSSGNAYVFEISGTTYAWTLIENSAVVQALKDASNAQDTADNKRRVFVSTPVPPYDVGDLWVQGSSGDIMRCQKQRSSSESYDTSDWVLASKYTDDTKANEAYILADSAKSVADNAKAIGDNLVNELGFQRTEITGEYVISPVIAGGTLLIGNQSGTYAQITTDGVLNANGANITGTITADYLTANSGGEIAGWKIDDSSFTSSSYGFIGLYSQYPDVDKTIGNVTRQDWRIIAGENFGVAKDGTLSASNASISGTLNSGSVLSYGVKIGTEGEFVRDSISTTDGTHYGVKLKSSGEEHSVFISDWSMRILGTNAVSGETSTIWFNPIDYADNRGIMLSSSIGHLYGSWYNSSGELISSDRNKKNSISSYEEEYELFFDKLSPIKYKYNDGSSNRFHCGFIAQDVESSLLSSGLDSTDFAGYAKLPLVSGGYDYYIRYNEFISLNTWQIQKLKARVEELEDKISNLELIK